MRTAFKPPTYETSEEVESQIDRLANRRWFTCIVEIPSQIPSVAYFWTRASSGKEASENAERWALDGAANLTVDDIDVAFVFEGKIEPVSIEE